MLDIPRSWRRQWLTQPNSIDWTYEQMFFPPICGGVRWFENARSQLNSLSEGHRISSVFLLLVLGFPHWWNGRIGSCSRFLSDKSRGPLTRVRARTYMCTHIRSRYLLSFTRECSPPHRGSSLASFLFLLPCFLPHCNRTNSGTTDEENARAE